MDAYQSPDDIALRTMGIRVASLTRRHEDRRACKRKAVASVIFLGVEGGWRELCHAVNAPMGNDPDRCIDDVGNCGCVHSEFKAVVLLLRSKLIGFNTVMVVSYSPCTPCANLIVQSKVVDEVYWLEDTAHDLRGIEILRFGRLKCGLIEHD